MISNPLTPAIPTSIVIKAVATVGPTCNPSVVAADLLTTGFEVWRATRLQNTEADGLGATPSGK